MNAPASIARARAFGFAVPRWGRYVAVDRDGVVWAYDDRPVISERHTGWFADNLGGRYEAIGDLGVECEGWRKLLLVDLGGCWRPVHLWADAPSQAPTKTDPQAVWRVAFCITLVISVIVLAKLGGWLP
jgi:hypothetical protein